MHDIDTCCLLLWGKTCKTCFDDDSLPYSKVIHLTVFNCRNESNLSNNICCSFFLCLCRAKLKRYNNHLDLCYRQVIHHIGAYVEIQSSLYLASSSSFSEPNITAGGFTFSRYSGPEILFWGFWILEINGTSRVTIPTLWNMKRAS